MSGTRVFDAEELSDVIEALQNLLEQVPVFRTQGSRDTFLRDLPEFPNIPRGATLAEDARNFLTVCLNNDSGIRRLLNRLNLAETGSGPWLNLKNEVERVLPGSFNHPSETEHPLINYDDLRVLHRHLRSLGMPWSSLRPLVKRCMPEALRFPSLAEELKIGAIVRHLAAYSLEQEGQRCLPLLSFVHLVITELLKSQPPEPLRDWFDAIWEKHKPDILDPQWPLAMGVQATTAVETYVLIALELIGEGCHIKAWLWPEPKQFYATEKALDLNQLDDNFKTQIGDEIQTILEHVLEEHYDANLVIEIFLPFSLLAKVDVSTWTLRDPLGSGMTPLGAQYPLVVRLRERLTNPLLRNSWLRKWAAWQAVCTLNEIPPSAINEITVDTTTASTIGKLFPNLRNAPYLYAVVTPAVRLSPEQMLEVLGSVLNAGLPLVLFASDRVDSDSLADFRQKRNPVEIRRCLLNYRSDAWQNNAYFPVTLLWDDGTRLPNFIGSKTETRLT